MLPLSSDESVADVSVVVVVVGSSEDSVVGSSDDVGAGSVSVGVSSSSSNSNLSGVFAFHVTVTWREPSLEIKTHSASFSSSEISSESTLKSMSNSSAAAFLTSLLEGTSTFLAHDAKPSITERQRISAKTFFIWYILLIIHVKAIKSYLQMPAIEVRIINHNHPSNGWFALRL